MRCKTIPLVLLFLFSLATQAQSKRAEGKLPIWSSDEAQVKNLATATEYKECLIKAPKDYVVQQFNGPLGWERKAWVGPTRSDGTRPYLMFVARPTAVEVSDNDLQRVLGEFLKGIERRRTSFTRTESEWGYINGAKFLRARWHGTAAENGFKMHGFYYVGLIGRTVIGLSSQDCEPHHLTALPVAEAAALTITRLPPK